ncbi:MAG TPA: glycosyltransferase [Acidobacteriaceae bacterium]
MFTAPGAEPFAYHDPWSASLDGRLKDLVARSRRIAYYYDKPDTSTFRYRAFNVVEALANAPELDISASWFCRDDLCRVSAFIDRADVLVICRARYAPPVAQLIGRARARNIPVLFDVDDLIFDPEYVHLIVETLDQDAGNDWTWDTYFALTGRFGAVLRMCDGAITTNERLASCIRRYAPGIRVAIVPNFLNRAQQRVSSALFAEKKLSRFARDECIHIGYFSGTPTHNRDFAVISGALGKLMDRDSRIRARVVGFLDRRAGLERHQDRIEVFPLQDFMNLQRLISQVEINVAPLQDNSFTNCKSELKYFEAAICGTITVATPTFAFANAIADGCNGFLANAHEWDEKLESALAVVEDQDAYMAIAERAFRNAEEKYGWDRHAKAVASAVFDLAMQPIAGGRASEAVEPVVSV